MLKEKKRIHKQL